MIPYLRSIREGLIVQRGPLVKAKMEVNVLGGALCLPFHREIFGLVQEVRGLFHDKRRNME